MEKFSGSWANRFIIAAIIQGGIITGITIIIVASQLAFAEQNIIRFLSLSFEGPAKWFFIGYIFYLILTVAVAVTAVFYNHLELNLKKRFKGASRVLAWIHLVGMNVGAAGANILMILAGLSGSGALGMVLGSAKGSIDVAEGIAVLDSFIIPIASFIGILGIGVICGGVAYILAYRMKSEVV